MVREFSGYLTTRTTSFYKISAQAKIRGSRVSEGVVALIQISSQLPEKYKIIEWMDALSVQKRFTGLSAS